MICSLKCYQILDHNISLSKFTSRQCDVSALLQQRPLLFYMHEQKLVDLLLTQKLGIRRQNCPGSTYCVILSLRFLSVCIMYYLAFICLYADN